MALHAGISTLPLGIQGFLLLLFRLRLLHFISFLSPSNVCRPLLYTKKSRASKDGRHCFIRVQQVIQWVLFPGPHGPDSRSCQKFKSITFRSPFLKVVMNVSSAWCPAEVSLPPCRRRSYKAETADLEQIKNLSGGNQE